MKILKRKMLRSENNPKNKEAKVPCSLKTLVSNKYTYVKSNILITFGHPISMLSKQTKFENHGI